MEAYWQVVAANTAKHEEARRYREAIQLEPSVGPWGFKIKAHFFPDHHGTPRGYTEVRFTARGHEFIYLLEPSQDFRTIHLQNLMKLNRPKAKSVPNVPAPNDYAYGLSA